MGDQGVVRGTLSSQSVDNGMYTLLQKKRNFSEPIFPGDPGSADLIPGYVLFVKWLKC